MKFYIISVLLALFFFGCEKNFDTVIDPQDTPHTVGPQDYDVSISGISNLASEIPAKDSVQKLWVKISAKVSVASVKVSLYEKGATGQNPIAVFTLMDNGNSSYGDVTAGDSVFTGYMNLSVNYARKQYVLSYSAIDNIGTNYLLIQREFFFLGKNDPPVINQVLAPDTLIVTDTIGFKVTAQMSDAQGLSDILSVYCVVYKPDGTSNMIQWELYDNGQPPDNTANDGIYSTGFSVNATNPKGAYRFEFHATDRSGDESAIVNHFIILR